MHEGIGRLGSVGLMAELRSYNHAVRILICTRTSNNIIIWLRAWCNITFS